MDPAYNFSELSLFNIGHQVASGLHFLSSSKVIHGDVAARNILVGKVKLYSYFENCVSGWLEKLLLGGGSYAY